MKLFRLALAALLAPLVAPAAQAQVPSSAPMRVAPTLTPLPVKAPPPVIAPVSRPVAAPIVALPVTPRPVVTPIERKPILVKMPEKPAYTLRPEAGEVKFGDGEHGRRPPSGRGTVPSYRRGAGPMLPAVQNPGKLAPQGPIMVSPLDDPRRTGKENVRDDPQMQQLKMQEAMQEQSKTMSTVSSITKSQHDTDKAIIDNLK